MPHRPQGVALFCLAGPFEPGAANVFNDFPKPFHIMYDTVFCAVKFHHQVRHFWETRARIGIAGRNGVGIKELDPGHWQAHLDRGLYGLNGRIH